MKLTPVEEALIYIAESLDDPKHAQYANKKRVLEILGLKAMRPPAH